eukprot:5586720-Pyramimonas_sp.AAC.1
MDTYLHSSATQPNLRQLPMAGGAADGFGHVPCILRADDRGSSGRKSTRKPERQSDSGCLLQ